MAKQYRPYLTLEALKILSSSTKQAAPTQLDLIRYLDKYISDIEHGLRKENNVLAPTLSQKLELEDSVPPPANPAILFAVWQSNGTLTVAEMELVNKYRYENDKMTPQEEHDYESNQGVTWKNY